MPDNRQPHEMTLAEFQGWNPQPTKPGYRLLYHATSRENVEGILAQGLLASRANAETDEPFTVWATTEPDAYTTGGWQIVFQVPMNDPVVYYHGDHVRIKRDIAPEDIVAVDPPGTSVISVGDRLSHERTEPDYASTYHRQYLEDALGRGEALAPEVLASQRDVEPYGLIETPRLLSQLKGGPAMKLSAAESGTPRVYVRRDAIKEYSNWGRKDYAFPDGSIAQGNMLSPEEAPETLYHVTTNAPAVRREGVLRSFHEGERVAGLGKGTSMAHQGISFTASPEDAALIEREMHRQVLLAREPGRFPSLLQAFAAEDERLAGLPPGALQKATREAIERFQFLAGLRQKDGGAVSGNDAFDAYKSYLWPREHAGGPENPILFGQPEHFAALDPEHIGVVAVPRSAIPEGTLVRTNPLGSGSDPLHEVMVHADVPVAGATWGGGPTMKRAQAQPDVDPDGQANLFPYEEQGIPRYHPENPHYKASLAKFLDGSHVQDVVYHATVHPFSRFDPRHNYDRYQYYYDNNEKYHGRYDYLNNNDIPEDDRDDIVDFDHLSALGVHFGSQDAANERYRFLKKREDEVPWEIIEEQKQWARDEGLDPDDFGFPERPAHSIWPAYIALKNPYGTVEQPVREADLRELLLEQGFRPLWDQYDGVIYQNDVENPGSLSYIVFSPHQIKSALGNQGTFNPEAVEHHASIMGGVHPFFIAPDGRIEGNEGDFDEYDELTHDEFAYDVLESHSLPEDFRREPGNALAAVMRHGFVRVIFRTDRIIGFEFVVQPTPAQIRSMSQIFRESRLPTLWWDDASTGYTGPGHGTWGEFMRHLSTSNTTPGTMKLAQPVDPRKPWQLSPEEYDAPQFPLSTRSKTPWPPVSPTYYHGTDAEGLKVRDLEPGHPTYNSSGFFGNMPTQRHAVFFTDNPEFAQVYGDRALLKAKHDIGMQIADFDMAKDAFLQSLPEDERYAYSNDVQYNAHPWMWLDDAFGERFVAFLKDRGYDAVEFTEYSPVLQEGDVEHEGTTLAVFDTSKLYNADHKAIVEQALKEGLPVPDEVVAAHGLTRPEQLHLDYGYTDTMQKMSQTGDWNTLFTQQQPQTSRVPPALRRYEDHIYPHIQTREDPGPEFKKRWGDRYDAYGEERDWEEYRQTHNLRYIEDEQERQRNLLAFLKDSVVKDAEGNPLVVYHATKGEDFNVFDPLRHVREQNAGWPQKTHDSLSTLGIHFGTADAADSRLGTDKGFNLEEAHDTYRAFLTGARHIPCYLNITRPLGTMQQPITESDLNELISRKGHPFIWQNYDGVIYQNAYEDPGSTSFIVFSPNQVKSALGNVGTYDPEMMEHRAMKQAASELGRRLDAGIRRVGEVRDIQDISPPDGDSALFVMQDGTVVSCGGAHENAVVPLFKSPGYPADWDRDSQTQRFIELFMQETGAVRVVPSAWEHSMNFQVHSQPVTPAQRQTLGALSQWLRRQAKEDDAGTDPVLSPNGAQVLPGTITWEHYHTNLDAFDPHLDQEDKTTPKGELVADGIGMGGFLRYLDRWDQSSQVKKQASAADGNCWIAPDGEVIPVPSNSAHGIVGYEVAQSRGMDLPQRMREGTATIYWLQDHGWMRARLNPRYSMAHVTRRPTRAQLAVLESHLFALPKGAEFYGEISGVNGTYTDDYGFFKARAEALPMPEALPYKTAQRVSKTPKVRPDYFRGMRVEYEGKTPNDPGFDWEGFLRHHGVPEQHVAGLHEPIDIGGGVLVPGGLEGTFSLADDFWLKANPVDLTRLGETDPRTGRLIPNALCAQLYRKLARTHTLDGSDPVQLFNAMLFGLLSPSTAFLDNSNGFARIRVRDKDELQALADLHKTLPKDRTERQKALAALYGTQPRRKAKGKDKKTYGTYYPVKNDEEGYGLGIGLPALNFVSEFADLFVQNPEWFKRRDDEPWPEYVDRISTQVNGLQTKAGSFATVFQDTENAGMGAIDRHMGRGLRERMFNTPKAFERWAKTMVGGWNRKVKARDRYLAPYRRQLAAKRISQKQFDAAVKEMYASGKRKGNMLNLYPPMEAGLVKTYDELLEQEGGEGFLTAGVFDELKAQKHKFSGKMVPAHLRDVEWIKGYEPVEAVHASPVYRNAINALKQHADEYGLAVFPTQWMLWDFIRGRLEPHETMHPVYAYLPKMENEQMVHPIDEHGARGFADTSLQQVRPGPYEHLVYMHHDEPVAEPPSIHLHHSEPALKLSAAQPQDTKDADSDDTSFYPG